MRRILGEEYGAFEKSYEEPRRYGLRVNTWKLAPEEFEQLAPFHLTKIPWIPGGYYYQEEDAAARHPFYHAGLYYLQEPSAMTPASVLDARPGERVLDLCAAPGGKATALGAALRGEGLLVANDISASRARALLKNIEVFGIANSFVTNTTPARLAGQFGEFFDKILVDAPCSGEGMFRKDTDTIRAWYPQKPADCAKTQREILTRAVEMLRPGGRLLYSTCTFAPEEDEEMVAWLLDACPQMELLPIPHREGFAPGLRGMERCVRLWPHKIGGEGHFLALFGKREEDPQSIQKPGADCQRMNDHGSRTLIPGRSRGGESSAGRLRPEKEQRVLAEFFSDVRVSRNGMEALLRRPEIHGSQVYGVPPQLPEVSGIPFLRNGLYLGELKKERFEPSQAFAMALRKEEYGAVIDLPYADDRVWRYLRGETVEIAADECSRADGWQLFCVCGFPLGWGKLVNGLLKNKYHAGWRMR